MSRTASLLLLSLAIACGDDDSPGMDAGPVVDAPATDAPTPDAPTQDSGPGPDAGGDDAGADAGPADDAGDPADAPTLDSGLPTTIGGDRPARVAIPSDYDAAEPTPLLILLHGYGASGEIQAAYLGIEAAAAEHGMFLVLPDGTLNLMGSRFWNATDACCDFARSGVDDVQYIRDLISEMQENFNVDAGRVYLFGHSNGGFMSYRMACDAADVITAIASLAGAEFNDETRCEPSQPVSVLQIHGTLDATIAYNGGLNIGNPYPGAETTVRRFAERNGCGISEAGERLDFDSGIPANETDVTRYTECSPGTGAELWTIQAGGHIPPIQDGAMDRVLTWLEQFSR